MSVEETEKAMHEMAQERRNALVNPFHDAPDADPEQAAFAALKQAACNLRDAELARIAAQKAYGEALDAFNRCVAPVNPT
jgi:hypothetical protein